MTTEEYVIAQREFNFKPGEEVLITRSAEIRHEDGWINSWAPTMSKNVGKVGVVIEPENTEESGVRVSVNGSNYDYPYFVLQRLKITNEERMRIRKEQLNESRR